MSLLVLMYHRARAGRHGNSPAMLDAHFALLARRYRNVLPGDSLAADERNVCLSFDDGYFDFYATVFPLLKKYNLRGLLAIPPQFVRERIDASSAERLTLDADESFAAPERGGFCTWPELEEMARSGFVAIAAHGLTHRRLDLSDVDLAAEIERPRTILATRLGHPVGSFVFPFGRYSESSWRCAKQTYRHVFRIGGALNRDWDQRLIYRVNADAMPSPSSLFSPACLLAYRARYYWNRLRAR